VTPVWIASDWHLSPRSPPEHARLAKAFLDRAGAAGVRIILNGDVFDDLFDGPGAGARALPEVARAVDALATAGRLERTRGNHDPDAGPARLVLEVPGLGRVLVAHGHEADPVNASPVGRLGDAVSRRFGRLALVRGAAALAELAARAVAGERLVSLFRARCLAVVRDGGFALGVFGHVHVAHAAAGDRYANAGAISAAGLSYLVLDAAGPRLALLPAGDVGGAERAPMR
jgi:predicted phosphodiesterase